MESSTTFLTAALVAMLLTACSSPPLSHPAYASRPPDVCQEFYRGPLNHAQRRHLLRGQFPTLTPPEWQKLQQINDAVNDDLVYLPDIENHGIRDKSTTEPPVRFPRRRGLPAARYGDCEDYALTKKQRLLRLGFPASRAYVVTARIDSEPERHTVLAIPEGNDWWILDCRHRFIDRASELQNVWDWRFLRPSFRAYQAARRP